MRDIVITAQWGVIALLLLECWVVFRNMNKKAHYYLFLNCVSMVVCSIGYMLMLHCETEEAYFMSMLASWSGKVCTVYSVLWFCVYQCERKAPKILRAICVLIALAAYACVATSKSTGLMYRNYKFKHENGIFIMEYDKGPAYVIWTFIIMTVITSCLFMLISSYRKEKNRQKRAQSFWISVGLTSMMLIGFLAASPIGKYYDFNQPGFTVCAVVILYAIFRGDLLVTETVAKEYMIDELSAGVVALDNRGDIVYFNQSALKVFPAIKNDIKGVVDTIEHSIETRDPVTVGDKIYTFEERMLAKGGKDKSRIYVMIDSTEHFQHMKELEVQKQIADDANQSKSRFLANMSHEIRTPINTVLGMDEMILRDCEDDAIKEYAQDIKTAGRTLLTIINDILDINKIESGKMELVPVEYDISKMIYDIYNMIRVRADEKKIDFEMEVAPDIPIRLFGDDVRVKQIIVNILTNAVKYTNIGNVWFRVRLNKIDGEEVSLHFEVEDTGIGIKKEDISKLFSEFERIEEKRNRNVEGTGLGMSITKKMLGLMGTRLVVESEYGKGSTFSFDLTQKIIDSAKIGDFDERVNRLAAKHKKYKESFTAPGVKILVVDDNMMNRKVFIGLLKATQIAIDEADSADASVSLASKNYYDVIFMDHMMPKKDGIEALKEIRAIKDGPCANTPIIVLTANAIVGSEEQYLDAGFDGFLAKPIAPDKLEELLRNTLDESKINIES